MVILGKKCDFYIKCKIYNISSFEIKGKVYELRGVQMLMYNHIL